MTITTNAGADDRVTPAERAAAELVLVRDGVEQDADARARAAALRGERPGRKMLSADAAPLELDMGDGGTRVVDDVVLSFEVEEPELGPAVDTLWSVSTRPREDPRWPFKPAGARGGMRPTLTPGMWEAVLDQGTYCLRCFGFMRDPVEGEVCLAAVDGECDHEHGPLGTCFRCALTPNHRARAITALEDVAVVWHEQHQPRPAPGPRQTASGIILPG